MAEQFRKASATLRHSPEQLRAAEQRAQEARSAATGIDERVAAFKRTAGEISAPPAEQTDAAAGITKKQPSTLKPTFNETAGGSAAPPPRSLWETFNEKAENAEDPRLREIKENARDITEKARKAIDLAREFRERAGPAAPPERPRAGRRRETLPQAAAGFFHAPLIFGRGRDRHHPRPAPGPFRFPSR